MTDGRHFPVMLIFPEPPAIFPPFSWRVHTPKCRENLNRRFGYKTLCFDPGLKISKNSNNVEQSSAIFGPVYLFLHALLPPVDPEM